ncbi:MAG TPA: acyl-CoA dehydrogenase [Desulfobulbaceae bacterium]|nr:acyl-CoA dehydrogenase [Desulfobulbaceae bacterium]
MSNLPKGGIFFFETTKPEDVFTPEDFNDEHKMIAESMDHFMAESVYPNLAELDETKNSEILKKMIKEAGDLGFLGMDIPERFGGTEVDEISTTIIAEKVGPAGSFSLGHGGQTGIGNLPIVYFGNEAQKAKYLPGIASGEKFSAYALTEPGAGSDALGAQTKAVLSEDGKYYILNGSKTFITNAGFADTFIVFAKINGEQFSGFVVESNSEGVTTGADEHKMGMKGSSTRTIFFDNVKVPVENLLFEPGKGAAIAFGILNIGRHKVSANSMGAAKLALGESAAYANERKQFGVPIASFGAIREKLADACALAFAAESAVYRLAGLIDGKLSILDRKAADYYAIYQKGIEEFASECALVKVFCSEAAARVISEMLQVHGGYGYIAGHAVEQLYRDERVQRIYEGTNEINRILAATRLLRLEGTEPAPTTGSGFWAAPRQLLRGMKECCLLMAEAAKRRFGEETGKEQEILLALADMACQIFALESAVLRAEKACQKASATKAERYQAVTKLCVFAGRQRFIAAAERGATFLGNQKLLPLIAAKTPLAMDDLLAAKRLLAEATLQAEKYIF